MQSINSIDITGVETFARLERMVALRGGCCTWWG
jgi:SulP family sulfate permease